MAYEERLQSDGAIYTNNYKQTDKQPDWTGKVAITKGLLKELVTKIKEDRADSVELRVALWNRTSKNGNEYKYARLDVPQQQKQSEPVPPPAPPPAPVVDDFDDDIPF
tara:strand:+ start:185 stop:508 length:324 start_codon:yes stop_codon:yes gene_type:complete